MKIRIIMQHNHSNKACEITKNKAIMDCTVVYSDKILSNVKALKSINYARLHKQVFLSFELVEGSGRDKTEVFTDELTVSQVRWTFCTGRINKPTKMVFRLQRLSIAQLIRQQIKTVCNFNEDTHQNLHLRQYDTVLIVNSKLEKELHVSEDRKVYRKVKQNKHLSEEKFREVIALLNLKEVLKV